MTAVPLPKGIVGIEDTPKQQEYLINQFFKDSYLLRTPGTVSALTSSETGNRGGAEWYVDEKLYLVQGGKFVRIESDNTETVLGDIAGTADCVFSLGQVNIVIIVKGDRGYTYNNISGLVQIIDVDFKPSDSVDFIDGRHVFIPSDGSPAFYSEVDNAGDIGPLNFFDAEELPDLNKFVINIGNELHIMGSQATERFRTTGAVSAPFARREGGRVDTGFVSGGIRYLGTYAFIGKNRDESYSINIMQSGMSPAISNSAINEMLNNNYTTEELEAVNSFSFQWKQSQFIGWNLPDITICFVDGNWVYLDSNLDATKQGPWTGKSVVFAYGKYYVANSITDDIGNLSDTQGEYGVNTEFELKTFIRSTRDSNFSLKAIELDLLTGQNSTTIGLALSRDAITYSGFNYKDLGVTGNYNHRIRWGGGLGRYESFAGVKIRGTGQVRLATEGMDATL